jgi:hypothetical protein
MTRLIFNLAFVLGVAAVVAMGANFLGSNLLALVVTIVIGGVFAIGAVELMQFRQATTTLSDALATLSGESVNALTSLGEWLQRLHPSLHHAVRQRVEGDRVSLPGPVLTPYLVSLLVMLGLLGTFVGLVETLKGVVAALEGSSDLQSIRVALTAPMDGLGLAFGTSVAGVAASAMLGLMSTLSRHDRVQATRQLDGRINTDLRRFSGLHRQQETFDALQLQSQSLPAIADKLQLLVEHVGNMTDKVGEQLTTNQDNFHQSVRTIYEELAVSVDKSLQGSVERNDRVLAESGRLIGEGIQPVVQQTMAAISDEVSQGVKATHEHLSRVVQDQLKALAGVFAKTSGDVASAWQDGLQAHGKSNEALVKRMQAMLAALDDRFAAASSELLDAVRQTTGEWSRRQEIEEQAQRALWVEALQHTGQQSADQFGQAAKTIIDELQSVSSLQQASIGSVTDEVAALSSTLMTSLEQNAEQGMARQQAMLVGIEEAAATLTESVQTGSSRMLAEIGGLISASDALVQARADNEAAWVDGYEQRMQQLATVLQQELAGLRDEEAQRGLAAVERLTELEATVTTHLATLGRALEEPMTHLIGVASETPRAAAEVIDKLRLEMANNIERDNQLLAERSRVMAELDAVSDSLAQSSAGQVAAIERLVESSATTLQAIAEQFAQQVTGETAKASEVADHVAASMAEVASLGEAFNTAFELYNNSNALLIENLQGIGNALEQSSKRSDEQLGFYVAQAREVVDYSVQAQREIFDELRRLKRDGGDDQDRDGLD